MKGNPKARAAAGLGEVWNAAKIAPEGLTRNDLASFLDMPFRLRKNTVAASGSIMISCHELSKFSHVPII